MKEGNEYGYIMLEQLPDIHADSSKCNPVPPVIISNINATNDNTVQNKGITNTEILLSLGMKELIGGQNSDTFCPTTLELIDDKKMSPDRYL